MLGLSLPRGRYTSYLFTGVGMYSYKDQLEIVKAIRMSDGDCKTLDCPFCRGRKKFTISKFDGKVVWNCFRASCNVKGIYIAGRSIEAAKKFLAGNVSSRPIPRKRDIPHITTKIENHPPAMEYLDSVSASVAYSKGLIRVRYAPAEDRVLFYNTLGNGAVGRTLSNKTPKWFSYGELEGGIHVGNGEHAVLVEDVASACAVARDDRLTGVALLGTNISDGIKQTLSDYTKITLVLDNDASRKSLHVVRKLRDGATLRFTKKDLKHLTTDEIRELLETPQ